MAFTVSAFQAEQLSTNVHHYFADWHSPRFVFVSTRVTLGFAAKRVNESTLDYHYLHEVYRSGVPCENNPHAPSVYSTTALVTPLVQAAAASRRVSI